MKTILIAIIVIVCLSFGAIVLTDHHKITTPAVPVLVETRKALIGNGKVVRIDNNSGKILALQVKLSRNGSAKTYDIVLNPQAFKEIGHLEGWAVVPGDHAEVSCQSYRTVDYTLQ